MKEIFKYIGNWGRYQIYVFCTLVLPSFMSGALTLISTFTQGVPNTRCFIPGYDSVNTTYGTPFYDNVSQYLLLSEKQDSSGELYCSYCDPSVTLDQGLLCNSTFSQTCNEHFVYDKSQYETTVTSLFDMVCDNAWKYQLIQSLYMVGVLIGSGVFGIIGDKYGRRIAFLSASLSQIVVLNVVPLAVNFYAFCILQIIVGALQQASFMIGFIIAMELFDGLPQTIFGIGFQAFFAVSYIYVGGMAYVIRNWQLLQYTVSVLSLLYIPYYWILPESIRWYILNNHPEDARRLIGKAAKWNRVDIPEKVLHEIYKTEEIKKASVLDLFKYKRMAIVTLIVFFTWMVCTLTYYGLSLSTSWLPGNDYVNFILSGVVELISYILCIPIMEYCGRRLSLVAFFGIGGVGCIISGLVQQRAVVITFTMLGKFCVSAAFAVTYNYTAEIFPTVVRSAATGISSLLARVGSIAAPQIALLAVYFSTWLPAIIYGTFGVAAALLDWFLPETQGQNLGETLEDGIKFLKDQHESKSRRTYCFSRSTIK